MFSLELPEEHSSPPSPTANNLSVTMDNSLSPAHTLIQIHCRDHKGLLYDIMRTLKDYNIQVDNSLDTMSQSSQLLNSSKQTQLQALHVASTGEEMSGASQHGIPSPVSS